MDPLILAFIKNLEEDKAREIEALILTNFTSLDQVTMVQGMIRGMLMAKAAMDAAARSLDSEE